jgi:hypothetical protein
MSYLTSDVRPLYYRVPNHLVPYQLSTLPLRPLPLFVFRVLSLEILYCGIGGSLMGHRHVSMPGTLSAIRASDICVAAPS